MQVRTFIGANAYACITVPGRSLDVLLSPGKSASASLRESAAEMQEQAARLIARAELIAQAADVITP